MDKKLKEAIADAKTVRETALANAKLALEETFSPQLKSMISARLQQEEDEKEGEEVEEETVAEVEDVTTEENVVVEDEMESEEEMEMEDEIEAEEEAEMEDEMEMEEEEDEDEIELEAIIRELESDEDDDEADAQETYNETYNEDREDDEKVEEGEDHDEDEVEEEIDLDEIIKSLREEDEEAEIEDEVEEDEAMVPEAQYNEAIETVAELRKTLNEVNVLNAKLLYANKLFRTYNLNESIKAKIIDAIDRAESVREIKLVYSTLAENFKGSVDKKTKTIVKEGFASKAQPSTKPSKEIITEANTQVTRFQKLAGIKK